MSQTYLGCWRYSHKDASSLQQHFTTQSSMNTPTKLHPRTTIHAVTLALLLGEFGMSPAMAKPSELQVPTQVSCIELSAALSGIETKGLFKVESETRLERGPYISAHEDAEGIYYRAPPGGVYIGPLRASPPMERGRSIVMAAFSFRAMRQCRPNFIRTSTMLARQLQPLCPRQAPIARTRAMFVILPPEASAWRAMGGRQRARQPPRWSA